MLCTKDSTRESRGKQSFYILESSFRITQLKQLLEVIPEQSLKSHCFKEQQMQPSQYLLKFSKIFLLWIIKISTIDDKNVFIKTVFF